MSDNIKLSPGAQAIVDTGQEAIAPNPFDLEIARTKPEHTQPNGELAQRHTQPNGELAQRPPLEFRDSDQPLDPFDLRNLVITPDYDAIVGKPLLINLRAGKPSKDQFFRVRPGQEYCLTLAILRFNPTEERDGGRYVINSGLFPQLKAIPKIAAHARKCWIHQCVTRYGVPFLWDIPMEDGSPRFPECYRTAKHAAQLAETSWVNLTWNQATRNYDVTLGKFELDPTWLDESFNSQLKAAFGKDGIIDSLEHPVIQQIVGEI